VIPNTHSIANLAFETHNTKPVLKPLEVEIEVKASALNFRDVLSVLKPTPQFDDVNAIGLDVCGIVVALGSEVTKRKLGDVVLGCNYQNLALPSHVVMNESSMVNLPLQMTFAEGATLPTVFITVYHCLISVAKLKAGETILIHTASGGVGLCAVQIAQDIGAKIVATAGSKRKRAYLNFIGVKNVFNSR
jgi:phthiocerol/phenolphthiocerol synthesis type-I polyketide synthase C